jgi:hypothetical protein
MSKGSRLTFDILAHQGMRAYSSDSRQVKSENRQMAQPRFEDINVREWI